ncbi:hypothetical protein BDK51DRAFT_37820, partial [Blyttiomyces helicus]
MSFIPANIVADLSRLSAHGPKPSAAKKAAKTTAFSSRTAEALPDAVLGLQSIEDLNPPPLPSSKPHNASSSRQAPHQRKESTVQGPTRPRTSAVTTPVAENAFGHAATAKRVSHLAENSVPAAARVDDLAFVYDSSDVPGLVSKLVGIGASTLGKPINPVGIADLMAAPKEEDLKREDEPNPINPKTMHLVVPTETNDHDAHGSNAGDAGGHHTSLRPTTRKEVALLKQTMIALLKEIGADMDEDYPTEMHALLVLIEEEQKIYDAVFSEIIRQVTVNMIERGEVIAEIRKRYANMFSKIPKHVRHLHTELVAQRKLNRRLSEELLRSKETVADLLKELEIVRKHDGEVTRQAQDAQEKLVSVLT